MLIKIMKIFGIVVVVLIGAVMVAQRQSDGPLNDIMPGGELRAGPLVSEPVDDWSFAHSETIELQLVEPQTSRYTGIMVYDGELYIPCDLGFMWGRFSGNQRHILHLIFLFKHWHEDAVLDGRAVLRIAGKRYERQAVRVNDQELLVVLKAELEEMARGYVAPDILGPEPTEGPRDVWFFRMDPRVTISPIAKQDTMSGCLEPGAAGFCPMADAATQSSTRCDEGTCSLPTAREPS